MKRFLVVCAVCICAISTPVFAYDKGDFVLKFGVATVNPEGDGALDGALDVDSNSQLGLTLTYMLSDNLGLNVLGALPFKHDIKLNGEKVAEAKHLPPTVTLQYHFVPNGKLNPYLGAGVNYTAFFSEESSLGNLSLDASLGLALEAGLDVQLNEKWGLNVAIWNIDIESDAKLNGAALDTVEIDPWAALVGAVYKF